ncbi:DNase I-like protein [Meira miltonrushii]|uniref:DNase I-like protein n=1 Tax=Meira miltonrushii TaxID=1280837 RepID=A0A316VLR3_9BASI|nr:DNase I-like protein [Meira miltonrushii]PWN37041.1 DNase I-like protein [Meira miltonrushii]
MDPYTPLFAALRPGLEQVKVAIECELPRKNSVTISSLSSLGENNGSKVNESPNAQDDDDATTTGSSVEANAGTGNKSDPFANRRIYALVTNVEQGHEEGCIFVFKRRRNDPTKVKIVDGLPILPGFKASVQQVARPVSENASTSPSTSASDLQIDMSLAGKSISASSSDAQSIRDLLKVVREAASRAEEVATERQQNGTNGTDDSNAHRLHLHRHHHHTKSAEPLTHAWVEHYMDVDRTISGEQTPIFSRFTTSAFLPPRTERPRAPSPAAGEVKVSFGTFNVNAQVPSFGSSSSSLNSWLHVLEDEPDILIIALQEVDSSGLSYVVWTPQVEAGWTDAIEASMGRETSSYRKLASKQLVGVLLFAYVRTSLLPRIGSPALASVGVGFGGWAANKGAVAIRFTLDDISLCFVGSHLSAFSTPEARERRRWDHHEIVKRLKFVFVEDYEVEKPETQGKDVGSEDSIESAAESALREQLRRSSILSTDDARSKTPSSIAADATTADTDLGDDMSESAQLQQWTIYDHDVVFWGGDLNSRLGLSTFEVKRLIRKRQFESTLLKFDQLRSELSSRASFQDFKEQEIDFAPTYKFDRGTDTYDTSEKQRCPAWTDRILWKEKDSQSRVHPIAYESAHNIRLSDHKPVLATFLLRTSEE